MGGPGITVLKGLVSNANDIAIIKQTIEDYTGKLTADYAVPVDYLTGPMMSFMTGKGDFDLASHEDCSCQPDWIINLPPETRMDRWPEPSSH